MRQRPMIMNIANMVFATSVAKRNIQHIVKLAEEIVNDTSKNDRLKKQECKACFYSSRVGGSAMTNRECMSCGEDVLYGSTATGVLCDSCARTHDLCKQCGGDINLRERRKEWPKPNKKPSVSKT